MVSRPTSRGLPSICSKHGTLQRGIDIGEKDVLGESRKRVRQLAD